MFIPDSKSRCADELLVLKSFNQHQLYIALLHNRDGGTVVIGGITPKFGRIKSVTFSFKKHCITTYTPNLSDLPTALHKT